MNWPLWLLGAGLVILGDYAPSPHGLPYYGLGGFLLGLYLYRTWAKPKP